MLMITIARLKDEKNTHPVLFWYYFRTLLCSVYNIARSIKQKNTQNLPISYRNYTENILFSTTARICLDQLILSFIFLPSNLVSTASCPGNLLMCDKEAIEVQKILPFLSDTWPLCRIGRAVIRASQSCRQSCNKSQCPACGCRSHHSCTHAPQFSRSFPAREWGSVLQRQGACGQCP